MIAGLLHTFGSTVKFIEDSVADLSGEAMTRQPEGVPNHAAWILGHLIYSCQGMAGELGIKEWLPGDWEKQFGYGSIPEPEMGLYPGKSELLAMLRDAANRLRNALISTDESNVARPLPDEESRKIFPTLGHSLLQIMVAHSAFHAGQLAAWRRAIGHQSAAVFI